MTEQDVAIVDAFQAATRAHTALVMCPGWRWRKREKLRSERDRLAAEADRLLLRSGAKRDRALVDILEAEQPS
jgi:hypothetical protein